MPMARPLTTLPTIRCVTFCAEHCKDAPTIQMADAIIRARRRPRRSETKPAQMAPAKEPADMDAVIWCGLSVVMTEYKSRFAYTAL